MSRDLAVHRTSPKAPYIFTLRRNSKKPWPELQWRHSDGRVTLRMPKDASLQSSVEAFELRVPWFDVWMQRRAKSNEKTVLLAGETVRLQHVPQRRKTIWREDDTLHVGSPSPSTMADDVAQYISQLAHAALDKETARFADMLGEKRGRLIISNAVTRWGACWPNNDLRFSWRLGMCPPNVLAYVAAHEVAHFRHRHHKESFWQEVQNLMPGWPTPMHWLRFHERLVMGQLRH